MLLYLLNVLLQTGQENWVGPTRICAGEGIQYWPSIGAPMWLWLGFPIDELIVLPLLGGPI